MKKFELTNEFVINGLGKKLYRIRALVSFHDVEAGDLGGYVESEDNLADNGDAWVYGDAQVYGNARVCGDAQVCGDAWVCGDAQVYGNARVSGDADYATVKGFGSEYRNTTFYRGKDEKIYVVCGCFFGDLEQFRAKVRETHKNSKYAKEYLMIANLMEMHFTGQESYE